MEKRLTIVILLSFKKLVASGDHYKFKSWLVFDGHDQLPPTVALHSLIMAYIAKELMA